MTSSESARWLDSMLGILSAVAAVASASIGLIIRIGFGMGASSLSYPGPMSDADERVLTLELAGCVCALLFVVVGYELPRVGAFLAILGVVLGLAAPFSAGGGVAVEIDLYWLAAAVPLMLAAAGGLVRMRLRRRTGRGGAAVVGAGSGAMDEPQSGSRPMLGATSVALVAGAGFVCLALAESGWVGLEGEVAAVCGVVVAAVIYRFPTAGACLAVLPLIAGPVSPFMCGGELWPVAAWIVPVVLLVAAAAIALVRARALRRMPRDGSHEPGEKRSAAGLRGST